MAPSAPRDMKMLVARARSLGGNRSETSDRLVGVSADSPIATPMRSRHSTQKLLARPEAKVQAPQITAVPTSSHLRLPTSATRPSGRPTTE